MRRKNNKSSEIRTRTKENRKRGTHLLAALSAAGLLALGMGPGQVSANEAQVPESVDINIQAECPDMPGIGKDKKAVYGFSHKAHVEKFLPGNSKYSPRPYSDEFVCAGCHAGFKDEKELLASEPCKRLEAAIEEKDGKRDVKNYFHSQCLACHKAMKKDKVATGPTSCKGCHSKKK